MDKLEYIIAHGTQGSRGTQGSHATAPNCESMGGKASTLAELHEKFTIPEWFVITPKAFLDCLSDIQKKKLDKGEPVGKISFNSIVKAEITRATKKLVKNKSQLVAVRSSATAEDGDQASFAGQLETYLNVPIDQVLEKVRDVWYSAFSDHVTHYRKMFGNSAQWLPAVIVQCMVKADVAGVAFSADPVTGDLNKCVINATQGLADKLVSGEVNGDMYYTTRAAKIEKQRLNGEHALLSQEIISEIVTLLLSVENHFGKPQDIEWAVENGKLYLLQARPITNLNNASKHTPANNAFGKNTPKNNTTSSNTTSNNTTSSNIYGNTTLNHTPLNHESAVGSQITIWDNSNIVESYSGVTSPLTFSFARYVYEHVYIEFCKFMGVTAAKVERENNIFRNMLGFVNGHVYYNLLNWYRFLSLFPGFKMNRKFMEQMMGVKKSLPEEIIESIVQAQPSLWEKTTDSLRFMRTLGGLVWHQIVFSRTSKRFYERLNDALSTSEALGKLPLDQLGKEYRNLENKMLKKWDAPLINDFLCMIAFGLSRKLLGKYAGEVGLSLHNDIMIGQGDIISAEPVIRIGRMAKIINKDDKIVQRLIAGDASAIAGNAELKKEYEEYLDKFGDRCLQELKLESPTLHDDPTMLLQAIGHMARRTQPKKINQQKDIGAELSPLFQKQFVKKWIVTKTVKWAKARVRDRENLRFERTRVFGRVRKIFLEIGKRFHELEYINNARDIFFLEVSEIMGLIEGTATVMNIAGLIKIRMEEQKKFESQEAPPNRFEVQGASYPAFRSQIYRTEVASEKIDGDNATGIACCQGVIKAPVRVIRNPKEAELKPGEIMVAQFTDPGWIMLFANASGILVERGSLLSHSAIVAREMGIPAIVAIDGIMTWLKTGDIVEMDGATGIVRKIENKGEHDEKK